MSDNPQDRMAKLLPGDVTSFDVKERLPAIVPTRTRKITVRYVEQCACKISEVPGSSAQCATVKNYGEVNGAQGRNRTTDTAIFNRMLYQLSYLGPFNKLAAQVRAGKRGARVIKAPPRAVQNGPGSRNRAVGPVSQDFSPGSPSAGRSPSSSSSSFTGIA